MAELKLEIIALCDYADYSREGKVNLFGIFDEIYPQGLSGTYSRCFIAFTVIGQKNNHSYKIKVIVKDPQKKHILEQDVEATTGRNRKANFVFEVNSMQIPTKGIYTISLLHNQTEIGSTHFQVTDPVDDLQTQKKSTTQH